MNTHELNKLSGALGAKLTLFLSAEYKLYRVAFCFATCKLYQRAYKPSIGFNFEV